MRMRVCTRAFAPSHQVFTQAFTPTFAHAFAHAHAHTHTHAHAHTHTHAHAHAHACTQEAGWYFGDKIWPVAAGLPKTGAQ